MPSVDNIRLVDLPSIADSRGVLTSIEGGLDIPFRIKRVFYMHQIVTDRGGHAHLDTDQVIVATSGRFNVEFSDGTEFVKYILDDPTKGIFVPRMIFINLSAFSPSAVCMVLASTHYDIEKSIRTWDEYMEYVHGNNK
jgi:dTDP-4-dehydrorhamnose 3,5-epimerase-like enzyme